MSKVIQTSPLKISLPRSSNPGRLKCEVISALECSIPRAAVDATAVLAAMIAAAARNMGTAAEATGIIVRNPAELS